MKATGGWSMRCKMKNKELSAFKDGVADALLEGYKSEWHENLYYYKQGYDFGLKMYDELKKINEVK